jgi:hypothetical protein
MRNESMGTMGITSSLSTRQNMGVGRCFLLLWIYSGYFTYDFDTEQVIDPT